MKKIGIVTIYDKYNFGNRLQNYALQQYIKKQNFIVETIQYNYNHNKILQMIKNIVKNIVRTKKNIRSKNFYSFEKQIKFSKYNNYKLINNYYDYFVVGSDQVWNPNFAATDEMLLKFVTDNSKKISYAASIGLNTIDKRTSSRFEKEISTFKAISLREDKGKEIIENITKRKDVVVLIDPTMLLSSDEWYSVAKKPKLFKSKKYVFKFFLGEVSEEREKEINRIAKKNNCDIIDINNKEDRFYTCGPSEFLYLEKNAFLICTDSFHSSVFAIIFNRPFVVFEREQKGMNNMNSRIDTLLSKLKIDNRRYNGCYITHENLNHDYTDAYKILKQEKEKSKAFFEKALYVKDSDNDEC